MAFHMRNRPGVAPGSNHRLLLVLTAFILLAKSKETMNQKEATPKGRERYHVLL
jgi:hypothetical protein